MVSPKLRFMIVDDDDFECRLFANTVHQMGHDCIGSAGNGRQALELMQQAKEQPVDIVVIDLNMPEMDGLELIRHIGQQHRGTAVIIASALGSKMLLAAEKIAEVHGIHLLGTVEKPLSMDKLGPLLPKYEQVKSMSFISEESVKIDVDEVLLGLREKQFSAYFQPKLDMQTGALVGAELLARWLHPVHGVVAPNAFIPAIEQSGDIDKLTMIMFEELISATRLFSDSGYSLQLAINLSIVSLRNSSLVDRMISMVQMAGIDPKMIIFEVTETAVMSDVAAVLENLARLAMIGFELSIDDFGTGYSSLQHFTRIAFSELKIDRSFVTEIAYHEEKRIVVRSSIDMAHEMKVKVVAEGVESQQDWSVLRTMGCDKAQGYFIARPMDMAAFTQYCSDHL